MIPNRYIIYGIVALLFLLPDTAWQKALFTLQNFVEREHICPIPSSLSSELNSFISELPAGNRVVVFPIQSELKTANCVGAFSLMYTTSLLSELNTAVIRGDSGLFNLVLKKYAVDYLALDFNKNANLRNLAAQSDILSLEKKSGNTSLYFVDHGKKSLRLATLPVIGPVIENTYEDKAYLENGEYATISNIPANKYYPFLNTHTTFTSSTTHLSVKEDDKYFYLSHTSTLSSNEYESYRPTTHEEISFDTGEVMATDLHKTNIAEQQNAIISYFLRERLAAANINKTSLTNCPFSKAKITTKVEDNGLRIASNNGQTVCFDYNFPLLSHKQAYLIRVDVTHLRGKPLKLNIYSEETLITGVVLDTKEEYQYMVIPPGKTEKTGYRIQFVSASSVLEKSEDVIHGLEAYAMPYDEVINTVYTKKNHKLKGAPQSAKIDIKQVENSRVVVETAGEQPHLVYYQPFNKSWKAYKVKPAFLNLERYLPSFFGSELKDKFVVSGWANGWLVPTNTKESIVIVYQPILRTYIQTVIVIVIFIIMAIFIWRATYRKIFERQVI